MLFLEIKGKKQEPGEIIRKVYNDLLNLVHMISLWFQYTTVVYTPQESLQNLHAYTESQFAKEGGDEEGGSLKMEGNLYNKRIIIKK